MARLTFPDEGSRLLYDPATGFLLPVNTRVYLYLDSAGTQPATDLLDGNGAPLTVGYVASDAYKRLPLFSGPASGADTLYAVVGGNGPITPIYARDDDRLDALAAQVAALEADSPATAVQSVNGHTGTAVTVTKADVGLGSVDNTADANKPVSVAQAAADAVVLSTAEGYTDTKVTALVNGAPGILDTLGEIATQLQSDESAAGVLATTVAGKAQKLTRTAVKTGAYTAVAGDLVPCDTTSAAFTVNLPNAPAVGSRVAVKLVTLGAGHAVTVACAGSDVFNKAGGPTSGTLTLLNQALQVQYDTGGIWTVVADDIPKSALDGAYAALLTPTATKTANYTAAPGDLVVCDTTSAAFTVTLPTTPADNTRIGAKIITQGGTNGVTVAAGGTDRIATGAATTRSLKILGEAVELQYQASTGLWFIAASDTPVGQLDLRYVGASATDSGGRVYTLKLDATNPPSTGTRGLVISRSAQGFPVGIRFEDTAGTDVAEIGLDSSTTDFVAYDDVTNGDILRFAQGGYALLGRGVGHPGNTRRLDITSSSTDSTLASLLHFTNDTGSSTADFIRGQNGASDVFNINKSGQAAFGKTYSGTVSGGSLEVANAAVISAGVGVTPGLQIITTGNATNRAWTWQISTVDGSISLKDSTGGTTPLQLQAGSAANTILIGSNFLRLGAAATSVGFYGSSGAAKQSVTGALSTVTDAAAKAVLTSILAAMTGVNLVTNSTT